MSGLIYEVAWVRSLELIFGATTFAVATVLAAFMGGLALGSFCMGRVAHRFDRFHPLIVYGAIECLIAVFALFIPTILQSLVPLYQLAWKYFHASFIWFSLIRFFLCAAILLVPTFLMGATLPIVSNFVRGRSHAQTRRIGLLYTFNTLGAVLGCASAGLILFPAIGLSATQAVAIGLNLVAAAGAFLLARRYRSGRLEDSSSALEGNIDAAMMREEKSVSLRTMARPRSEIGLLVALYAISGFTAMLYEVAWSRVLVLILGSSTYAYTIMLTTFLFGLSLGAYLATRFLPQSFSPLFLAGICQVLIALATYLGVFLVEELPFFYLQAFESFHFSGKGLLLVQFALAVALMILPTLGLGAMFPLTIRGISPSADQTARAVGWSYSLNTCGAIAGSVLAGFWLVPRWGSQNTILVGIFLNSLFGVVGILAVKNAFKVPRYRRIFAILVFGFMANLFLGTIQWRPYILSSGIFRYVENYAGLDRQKFREKMRENRGDILFFKEGLTCTVTVCQTATGVSLLVNGKPDASVPSTLKNPFVSEEKPPLRVGDLPTQILLGQIPMLLAQRQDRVMVIGLGSGVTLGSVLRHPVKHVECVELEKAVVQSCRFFHAYNGRPLYDKRVELVVNDARNHLLVTDRQYDVIISEPSNPWIAGAASLFTSEFFQIAKTKLQSDGIFCQWLQLYELRAEDLQAILRSFTKAFPYVHIFRVDMDAILVGTLGQSPIHLEQLQARLIPEVKSDLARMECPDLESFLSYYWIGGQEVRQYLQPGPLNSDDNMLIEFTAPLRMLSRNSKDQIGFVQELAKMFSNHSTGLIPHLQLSQSDTQRPADIWAAIGDAALTKRRINEAQLYAEHSLELARTPRAAQVKGDALVQGGKRDAAIKWWEMAEHEFPSEPLLLRALARFHQASTNYAAACEYAERLILVSPDEIADRFLLGHIRYQLKDWAGALALLEPLSFVSNHIQSLPDLDYYLGSVYWHFEKYNDASLLLHRYLNRIPNHLDARYRLADSLFRAGRQQEGFVEWQRVGQLRSSYAQVRLQEGKAAWQQGKREEGLAKYEESLQFDPWNEEIYFVLSRVRKQMGDTNGAVVLLEKFLTASPDRPWAVDSLAQISAQQGDINRAVALAERYQALTGLEWRGLSK